MAAAKRISAEAQTYALLRSLQCPLCRDRFNSPKQLDCGHLFCTDCLKKYVSEQSSGKSTAMQSKIACPTCQKMIELSSNGVDDLQTHVFYRDIAKEIQVLETENKLSRGSCKFCSDNAKLPATVKCLACQVPMCEKCSSNHVHNGVTNVVTIHRKQDSLLCDVLPKRDTACDIHPTESLLLFCAVCKCCVCFKCKDEKHSEHEAVDISDIATPARVAIEDVHGKLTDYLVETKEALEDINRIGKEYNANVDATKKQINSQIQQLIDHILKERDSLIKELDDNSKEVRRRLDKGRQELEVKDSTAKTMEELTENLLRYGNDAENVNYRPNIEHHWKEICEQKLNRFGQGYKMSVQFYMNDGFMSMLSKQVGRLRVTQTLSPWTARKSVPFIPPNSNGNVDAKRIKAAMSNDFSLKRSPIFSKIVDPKWNLETYKTDKSTGETVTVWMKIDEEQEQLARASKRISMRANSCPSLIAEINAYSDKGEQQYSKTMEKLPDGTIVRLAIVKPGTILLAMYPGLYASSIIGQAKLRSLSRKEVDGIYVAVFEKGTFLCGELRKIPIPEGPGFDFDITSRGMIVLKSVLSPDVKLYSSKCQETITNHASEELSVLKLIESPENDITVVSKDTEGNLICDKVMEDGQRVERFTFPSNFLLPLTFQFRDMCFDRKGNALFSLQAASQHMLYLVHNNPTRIEFLSKPEMLHHVEKLAALPDGRLCVFDKTECILMTLRYL